MERMNYREAEKVLKEYQDKIPETFRKNLDNLSWGTLANLLVEYQKRIEKESSKTSTLQKRLGVVIMILTDQLNKAEEGKVVLDAKFMRDLVKLLHDLKRMSITYRADLEEFMVLIALMLEKMKKEKLIVYSQGRFASGDDRDKGKDSDLFKLTPEIERPVKRRGKGTPNKK